MRPSGSEAYGCVGVNLPASEGVHGGDDRSVAHPRRPEPRTDPAIAASSRASFEGFFAAERARLFGALIVMTDNRAEAEEILQDAFLKVWERWERVAGMDEPVGFLYRTAMNLFRKRLRRAGVAVRKAVHLLPDGTSSLRSRPVTKPPDCCSGSRPGSVPRSS